MHGYWRLKQEEEVLSREAKKKADLVRTTEHDWARIKGKLAKLNMALAPFEDSYREVDIEGGE